MMSIEVHSTAYYAFCLCLYTQRTLVYLYKIGSTSATQSHTLSQCPYCNINRSNTKIFHKICYDTYIHSINRDKKYNFKCYQVQSLSITQNIIITTLTVT